MSNTESVNGQDDVQDRKQKKHDTSKYISNAVNLFADKRNKEHEEKLAKEHELQKIQVKKEHLELIMTELEVSTTTGEKALRESKGDVVLALKNLIKVAERVIDLDLERVTDWTEESEISKDISNAVNLFADKRNKEHEEKLAKEHELQKIQVKKEHLELVMTELEVSATTVEKALRENKGDVVLALTNLIEESKEANFKKAFNLTLSNLMKQNIVVLPTKNDESF